MLRRIPDKNTVSLFEKADLFIEEDSAFFSFVQ